MRECAPSAGVHPGGRFTVDRAVCDRLFSRAFAYVLPKVSHYPLCINIQLTYPSPTSQWRPAVVQRAPARLQHPAERIHAVSDFQRPTFLFEPHIGSPAKGKLPALCHTASRKDHSQKGTRHSTCCSTCCSTALPKFQHTAKFYFFLTFTFKCVILKK